MGVVIEFNLHCNSYWLILYTDFFFLKVVIKHNNLKPEVIRSKLRTKYVQYLTVRLKNIIE